MLNGHLKSSADKNINPFHTNLEEFERFGEYCAQKGRLPKRLTDNDVRYGLTLISYDLTDD